MDKIIKNNTPLNKCFKNWKDLAGTEDKEIVENNVPKTIL